MVFMSKKITFSYIKFFFNLDTTGGVKHPLRSRSVASLPRFAPPPPPPPLTNPGCTTVTDIAKGYKGPCPPIDWNNEI